MDDDQHNKFSAGIAYLFEKLDLNAAQAEEAVIMTLVSLLHASNQCCFGGVLDVGGDPWMVHVSSHEGDIVELERVTDLAEAGEKKIVH